MAGSAHAVEREPRIRPKYTRPFSSREVGSGNETILWATNQAQVNDCRIILKDAWTNPIFSMLAGVRDRRHDYFRSTMALGCSLTIPGISIMGGAKCMWHALR